MYMCVCAQARQLSLSSPKQVRGHSKPTSQLRSTSAFSVGVGLVAADARHRAMLLRKLASKTTMWARVGSQNVRSFGVLDDVKFIWNELKLANSDDELTAAWKKRKEAEAFLQRVKQETAEQFKEGEKKKMVALQRVGRAVQFQKQLEKQVAQTSAALSGPAPDLTEEQKAAIQAKAAQEVTRNMSKNTAKNRETALVAFYEKHNAEKVDGCAEMLEKYQIGELAAALHAKYGEIPAGWESELNQCSTSPRVHRAGVREELVAFYKSQGAVDKMETVDEILEAYDITTLAGLLHDKYGSVPEGWQTELP